MQHLSDEALARLADEEATGDEVLHLERCERCRAEVEAIAGQTRALGELPELAPPADAWPALAERLAEEGLLERRSRRGRHRPLARAAAALALFLGGAAVGTLTPRGGAGTAAAPVAETSPADAEARLHAAEAAYLDALTRYAEATGADATIDPLNRLAALEGIVLTTRAALQEAPADPVINGYHLAALGQRDAILRQIDAAEDPWY